MKIHYNLFKSWIFIWIHTLINIDPLNISISFIKMHELFSEKTMKKSYFTILKNIKYKIQDLPPDQYLLLNVLCSSLIHITCF